LELIVGRGLLNRDRALGVLVEDQAAADRLLG